jgi:chromate transporter
MSSCQPEHGSTHPEPGVIAPTAPDRDLVPFRSAVRAWFLVSLQTFGGPAGQIAVMQRVLVDERRWIGQKRFLHALNYCMLLPGPEAQQLAIYVGWLLNGARGGLVAGTLFVIPGVLALLALSAIYVAFGETTAVVALFAGLAPAVLAIVAQAVIRVGRRALAHPALVAIAAAAFLALAVFSVPFPVVVVAAAAAGGWALGRFAAAHHAPHGEPGRARWAGTPHPRRRPAHRTSQPAARGPHPHRGPACLGGSLGRRRRARRHRQRVHRAGPVLLRHRPGHLRRCLRLLAYVAQRAVEVYGWLAPGEMVRGLALAETTPGPLIMVVQFVAFLGAYRDPGSLDPWVAALIGALLTTWVTFVPCFLFIFLGAPYIERLRSNRALSAALTGITAAVVGVIANLALYFTLHTLFAETRAATWGPVQVELPDVTTFRPLAVGITIAALVMIFRLRWSMLRTLGACAALGLAAALTPLPLP